MFTNGMPFQPKQVTMPFEAPKNPLMFSGPLQGYINDKSNDPYMFQSTGVMYQQTNVMFSKTKDVVLFEDLDETNPFR
jgi:hypothetical protein